MESRHLFLLHLLLFSLKTTISRWMIWIIQWSIMLSILYAWCLNATPLGDFDDAYADLNKMHIKIWTLVLNFLVLLQILWVLLQLYLLWKKSITKIKSHHVIILFAKVCSTFKLIMQNLAGKIVDIAIEIHEAVSFRFLSSASKFMYNWNMRELANIFQGCYHANNIFANQPLCASKISWRKDGL